jgi:3-methylcrotonyl-CoA carboxylase alpha subunit
MDRLFRRGDEELKVAARRDGERLRVETAAGERVYEWDELGPGDYVLRVDGQQRRCIVARAGDERWIWIEGHTHHLKVATAARRRASAPAGELTSPMPGRVLKLLAEPGQAVRKDEVLVVLEAMKMQYEIVAPRDGVVRSVQATAGAQVASGVPLVTLQDEEGAA